MPCCLHILAAIGMISLTSMLCADDISYKLVSDFPQWPAGMKSGAVSGVAIDATGEIVVAHRSGPPISIFTKEGVHIRSFGEKIFASVHGVRVDGDNHIWATDMKWHIVVKMEMTGRVLMTLGERDVPGDDKKHFNRPTDVAIASNGDIFVADGYGNSRIVKFDRDGKFLKSWGGRGTGKGLLHLPHAMVIDARAQIYVADRENNRIQVFDIEGGFIRQFGGFTPYGLCLGPDEKLYVADGRKNKVMRMSREGEVDVAWGMKAGKSGDFDLPHGIAVGADGSVYIAEINGERLRKYEPH